MARAVASRCCLSDISTWWRRSARTGRPTRSNSIEKDGYFYGRGTLDMKDGDAIMVTTLLRMKQEGFRPDRDIILALTADEEGGCWNGVDWLMNNHRELIDAEFVLNHGRLVGRQRARRAALSPSLERHREGLRRLPADDHQQGGSQLVADARQRDLRARPGPAKVAKYHFPFELNYHHARLLRAAGEPDRAGRSAADMHALLSHAAGYGGRTRLSARSGRHSMMHTTCVATRLAVAMPITLCRSVRRRR